MDAHRTLNDCKKARDLNDEVVEVPLGWDLVVSSFGSYNHIKGVMVMMIIVIVT